MNLENPLRPDSRGPTDKPIEPQPLRPLSQRQATVSRVALSSLQLKFFAAGKDKQIHVVKKKTLLEMDQVPLAEREIWKNSVFIEPLVARKLKLIKEEFDRMEQIRTELDLPEPMESYLAINAKKIVTSDGKEYYMMPKGVENGEKAIQKDLAFDKRISYCKNALEGLRNLHSVDIVHGDLKPENLLTFEDGVLRIADFGRSTTVPTDKSYLGNTRFGPPEGTLSKAGDVYGAALLLIRMLEEAVLPKDKPHSLNEDFGAKKYIAPSDSRRGVERFFLEHPDFTRTYETSTSVLGKARDIIARGKTTLQFVSDNELHDETVALWNYIGLLCSSLETNDCISPEQKDALIDLLLRMTHPTPELRPTTQEVLEHFNAAFESHEPGAESPLQSNITSAFSQKPEDAYKTVFVSGTKTPLGKGKVNVVYNVSYIENGQEVNRVFKPTPGAETSLKETLFGSAVASGIPTGIEARLPERAVAASIVDKLLFKDNPISVTTRFAIVNGEPGVLMDKAEGASPKVISETQDFLSDMQLNRLKRATGNAPLTAKTLNKYALHLKADRVEAKIKPDGSMGLAVTRKQYENFSPENPTTALGLLKLQVLDIITGQVDRHPGNYFIDKQGRVQGIDQDCAFGVNAWPKGENADVRRQPALAGIIPNMGSLMLRMPAVVTESVAKDVLALLNTREKLAASLQGLISPQEIEATIQRLQMLASHIANKDACRILTGDDELIPYANEEVHLPAEERRINADNSYYARERDKFRSGETSWNYLRAY